MCEEYSGDVLRSDKYCTLLVMYPQESYAVYLDSGSAKPKDYNDIKSVLNDALTVFANKTGGIKVERKRRGGLCLSHRVEFPCQKQSSPNNEMEGWYAILHMREFVNDENNLLLPRDMANCSDTTLREEWIRIQQFICTIIHKDFCSTSRAFFNGHITPCNEEIETLLWATHEVRPFNSLKGCHAFLPKKNCR
jgi:hypothetical protein